MDPNLFHLDWDRLLEVIFTVVAISIFLERALSLLFEHRWFIAKLDKKGFKEPIAFACALAICRLWEFDALSMIILQDKVTLLGEIITAGVIAGGSKGSVALFRTYLGWKSTAAAEASGAPKPQ